MSFADPQGTAWSLLFKTEQDSAAFLRYAALVRAHQSVHGTDSADADGAVGTFDILAGKADQPELTIGDAAGVTYSAWDLQVGAGAAQPPHAAVAQPAFASSTKPVKVKLGEGEEPVPGVEEGVVGMRKGGRRILLVPPALSGRGSAWVVVELNVVKVKSKKDKTEKKARKEKDGSAAAPASVPVTATQPMPAVAQTKAPLKT